MSRSVGLLGLPYDANSSFLQGAKFAPSRIREALRSDHWNMTTEKGIDLDIRGWEDYGDVSLEELSGALAFDRIEKGVGQLLDGGASIISIGGDHSVSFPVIKAHAERHNDLNVLHIDAHPDLYDQLADNHYSHASPFSRIMELGLVKRLVQVGIRTLNEHQRAQAERFGVELIEMREWKPDWKASFDGPVYLSLDLDALDPAYAPGVSHLEPGGLSSRDVINIIQTFEGRLIGADVVELNPIRDFGNMTAIVAAKMVKELFGRIIHDTAVHMVQEPASDSKKGF